MKKDIHLWYIQRGLKDIIITVYIVIQVVLFVFYYISFYNEPSFSIIVNKLGHGLVLAKSTAFLININFMILFLSINKAFVNKILNFSEIFPIHDNIIFHKVIAVIILFLSIIHTCSHIFNFINLNPLLFITSVAGITGILLVIFFILLYSSVFFSYNTFFYFHSLYIPILISLLLHGSFCFVKDDNHNCNGSNSYKFILGPFLFYFFEHCYRNYIGCKPTYFTSIIKHSPNLNEITFYKPGFSFSEGQWILLKCPTINKVEWHPFTITSNPIEYGKISVFINQVGDWTNNLIELLHNQDSINTPNIVHISYPYGNDFNVITKYKINVLFASGIGITAFMSLLKRLNCSLGHDNEHVYMEKIYIYWVCRNINDFNCFLPQLTIINNNLVKNNKFILDINLYLTNFNNIYRPLYTFNHGRPNLDNIFLQLSKKHKNQTIKILYCGNNNINNDIFHKSIHYSKTTQTIFFFQKGETII